VIGVPRLFRATDCFLPFALLECSRRSNVLLLFLLLLLLLLSLLLLLLVPVWALRVHSLLLLLVLGLSL
jgi:hypothetical protein